MPPSVRPDGRPSRGVCKIGSDTGQTVHFRAVCAQRGALKPDVRPWRRHMIGWPIWPAIDLARPCECHATTTRERPATSPCLLALPADARQSPKEKARARKPTTANRAAVNWICVSGYNREVCSVDMGAVSHAFTDLSWRRGLCAKKPRVGIANGGKVTGAAVFCIFFLAFCI